MSILWFSWKSLLLSTKKSSIFCSIKFLWDFLWNYLFMFCINFSLTSLRLDPQLLYLIYVVTFPLPAVNGLLGDKCIQTGLNIGAVSCPGCCLLYLLTWVHGHAGAVLSFKYGRWQRGDSQSPAYSARQRVCVLDVCINQFIKSADVQESNVRDWYVPRLQLPVVIWYHFILLASFKVTHIGH